MFSFLIPNLSLERWQGENIGNHKEKHVNKQLGCISTSWKCGEQTVCSQWVSKNARCLTSWKGSENLGPQDPWSFITVNITNALLSTRDSFWDLPIPMFLHLKSLLKCYSCRTCHNPPSQQCSHWSEFPEQSVLLSWHFLQTNFKNSSCVSALLSY